MSTVVLFGRTSRPRLPCWRAAVAAYLFHCAAIDVSSFRSRCRATQTACALSLWEREQTEFAARSDVTSQEWASEHAEVLRDNGVVELDLIGGAAKHHPA